MVKKRRTHHRRRDVYNASKNSMVRNICIKKKILFNWLLAENRYAFFAHSSVTSCKKKNRPKKPSTALPIISLRSDTAFSASRWGSRRRAECNDIDRRVTVEGNKTGFIFFFWFFFFFFPSSRQPSFLPIHAEDRCCCPAPERRNTDDPEYTVREFSR